MMNRFITGMPPVHAYYSPGILSPSLQSLPSPAPQHPSLTPLHHSHPTPVPSPQPTTHRMAQIFLVKQTSLLEEKFSKNGIQKNLHVVVKNTPFTFTLSLAGASEQINFHRFMLEAALLYDFDEPKEVDFVRLKPLEYRSQSNDPGDSCTVEMRIKVLSSQLEDMYFRIRFTAYDSVTRGTSPGLVVYSEPIKVISKPDQIVKKKEPKSSAASKKSLSDLMSETLSRIEEQQREQKEMLSILNSRPRANSNTSSTPEVPKKKQKITSETDNAKEKEAEKEGEQVDPLEKEFLKMIRYFEELTYVEKKNKVRKVKEELGSDKQDSLQELIDLLLADNKLNQRNKATQTSLEDTSLPPTIKPTCNANDCRSVKERADLEQFYSEFIGSWQP